MPASNAKEAQILTILSDTQIDGLDIPDALGRLNNSAGIFMRIIRSFVQNMPATLAELAAPSADTLASYSIKVHGAKGSLYGIGANACGDAAKVLEIASKAGDLSAVLAQNDAFLSSVEVLLAHLAALEARVEAATTSDAPAGATASAPSREQLQKLLEATREYDMDAMQEIIADLASKSYASGDDDIRFIKEQFESFAYDKVEQRTAALLS